ncbi:hypothetical protein IC614_09795 [Allosphingosinicella flava]|uniref:Uncharacterized protein n=1 Tax=Allosphingosinicella flava TaxID=2771430 RepID=A0A7T2GIQ8_9SPHN|nr:hypothetical protein [Sphingosinicella flava]QPQ54615.1 hypothetical protein IC614_09795 [Sphingosinicella flava]
MRRLLFLLILPCLAAAAPNGRQAIGQFHGWGAFRDDRPRRCFAAAEPAGRQGSGGAAYVAFWPDAGNRARFSLSLRADPRPGSAILLAVGDRRFQFVARGRDAVPADPRASAAIVAAMRTASAMTVVSRSVRGARLRDDYALAGFPSAVDAAALACARW